MEILFLSKAEVESLITVEGAVNAAEEAYRALGEGQLSEYHLVMQTKGPNIINTMPAFTRSKNIYGVKQGNVYYEMGPGDDLPRTIAIDPEYNSRNSPGASLRSIFPSFLCFLSFFLDKDFILNLICSVLKKCQL